MPVEHGRITYRTETDTDPYKHTVPSRLDMPIPCKPELMPLSPLYRHTETHQKFDSTRVPAQHGLLQWSQTLAFIRAINVDVVLCDEFDCVCVVASCNEVVEGADV